MRERQKRKGFRSEFLSEVNPAQELGALDETLQVFRDAMRASAERPDYFWKRQHSTIMASLKKPPASKSHSRPALLWATAALALVLCLFFFVENSKAPTPDLAAGSDEILLIDVERALSQDCPEALAPAGLLPDKRPSPLSTK